MQAPLNERIDSRLVGKRVILRGLYTDPLTCVFIPVMSNTIEPSYRFCYWLDFESIKPVHVYHSFIDGLEERDGCLEIRYTNIYSHRTVLSPNRKKATAGKDQFEESLKIYEEYRAMLLALGINPPDSKRKEVSNYRQ